MSKLARLGAFLLISAWASGSTAAVALTPLSVARSRRAALDSLPWPERIALERAVAEHDARYAPRADAAGVVLASGPVATITARGAAIEIGGATTTIGLASIGRGSRRTALGVAGPEIRGAEVEVVRAAGIVEWWRALPSGLEHGVTIASRPDGEGTLVLEVAVDGALRAEPAGADAVALVDASGRAVAHYAHLVVVDASGRALPARMAVVAGGVRLEIEDSAARYPVVVDPLVWAEEATLLASGGAAADWFGYAVALTGDGSRALVGAFLDRTAGGAGAGSARVFVRSGSAWTEEATLLASGGAANDFFGCSVALSGDGSRALVGAYMDDTAGGGLDAGSARVFVRSGSAWTEEATLLASGGAANDLFGWSVALSGDGSRALVGAYNDDTPGGVDAGSARVFVRSGTSWTEEAMLLGSGGAAGDEFGGSVALSGDGIRALVGAYSDDTPGGVDAGSARVFVRSGTSWTEEATLLASGAGASDGLGVSVALSGDASRALVGAPFDDTAGGGVNAGSASVFVRSGTSWTEEATLLASGGAGSDEFGLSVALSGDGSRALAGAYGDDTASGGNAGSARVFVRSGTSWTEEATLLASGGAANDQFGYSVALSGDGSRAFVGAFTDDTPGGVDAGSARVFTLESSAGAACSVGAACVSGSCVDGVCCASACAGGASDCQACSVAAGAAIDGTCGPLLSAMAPTITCRVSAGVCDVAEVCTSASTACPTDVLAPATTPCRAATDLCDAAESCDGASAACPADALALAGTGCRAALGVCDVAESCDGASAACPADALALAGVPCRPAIGACDLPDACSGTDAACSDLLAADGAPCSDADLCNGDERCAAGACGVGAPLDCDDGNACTADACDALTGCSHSAIASCCAVALDCDDADACTTDSCVASSCVHAPIAACGDAGTMLGDGGAADGGTGDAGPSDATVVRDAAAADAGEPQVDAGATAPLESAGCSCRAAGTRPAPAGMLMLGVVALLARVRRRSRRSAQARRRPASPQQTARD